MGRILFLIVCFAAASEAFAAAPENLEFGGNAYTVVKVDLKREELKLYWKDAAGERIGDFKNLRRTASGHGRKLVFATNAGIFEIGYRPLGLHMEEGRALVPLNMKEGEGNFYLKPGGVFFVNAAGAAVVDAGEFEAEGVRLATQSGPMLVKNGVINPRFSPSSGNRKIRSGVGVTESGLVVFALSRMEVSFHEFAGLFRERLKCPNALFLDGTISRMFLAGINENEEGDFAGILAVEE